MTHACGALATLAVIVLTAMPAAAPSPLPGSTAQPANATRLVLAGQPAWVAVGGDLPLELQVQGQGAATPGLTVSITAHQATSSRSGYRDALQGKNLGSVLGHVDLPLDLFPPSGDGNRTITVGLQPDGQLPLSRTGVYPFEVELRDPDRARVAGFVTPVVAVEPGANGGPAIGKRLGVTWVMPMVTRPAYQIDGKPDPEVVAELQPDGRLGRQATAIANSSVPLTLAPGPETLESWTQLAHDDPALTTSLNAFRDALNQTQVLSGSYVPIDVPSLVAGGLSDQVGPELVQGSDKLNSLLGTRVDSRTEITHPLNDAGLSRLREAGVDRVILDGSDLAPRNDQFTPAQPFVVRSQQGTATAVGSDTDLQHLLDGADPPALRAQRFLAGLAVVALEQPNVARGVVVLNPDDWDGGGGLVEAVLTGLGSNHPLLQPMTVDQLVSTVPPATNGNTPVERQFAPSPVPAPPVTPREYDDAQGQLNAFNMFVPPPNPMSDVGNRALLVSLSSIWSGSAGRTRARDELGRITLGVHDFLGHLRVPAGNSTITLTARKGQIPVTFLNETDQDLRVRVKLQSDKLLFPDGDTRVLQLPPRNTTVRFTVETRSSGTFPLTLAVTSPDGSLTVQQTQVKIRSTFVSNVGVFITVGAILFLGLWWANDFRRRRKRRAAQLEAAIESATTAASDATPGARQ